jgi:hypothetical protein
MQGTIVYLKQVRQSHLRKQPLAKDMTDGELMAKLAEFTAQRRELEQQAKALEFGLDRLADLAAEARRLCEKARGEKAAVPATPVCQVYEGFFNAKRTRRARARQLGA